MNRVRFALLLSAALWALPSWSQTTSSTTPAQTPEPTKTPDPAPAPPPAKSIFTVGKVDISGSADVYYSFNNEHPSTGFNQLYNFNDKTDQFNLNMAKLTASMDPAPIGFRIDIGLGRTFDIIYPYGTPSPGFMRYVEQAYISVKPKSMKGFEADLGEFATSAGAEVIETKDNWNYSRSLLFAWAAPYLHFGVRTTMPIGSSFVAGVQVVDGWNSIVSDTGNNMQTVGLVGNVVRKKYTWNNVFYTGPNENGINKGNRSLYDTVLLLTPNDKLGAYIEYDYATQDRIGGGSDHYAGAGIAAHYQITKKVAVAARAEYFSDPSGYSTGTGQRLHEITTTADYKWFDGLLSRIEYRHDTSNVPFFVHGVNERTFTQSTFTIGLIAYFAPKH